MRRLLGIAAVLSVLAASTASGDGPSGRSAYYDRSLPAVSAFNGKIEAFGGEYADEELAAVAGSISFPLSKRYGLQVDALAGSADDEGLFGIGAHLFWRDPSKGLLGVYGDHVYWDSFGGNEVSRLAAEGELYLGRISLEGMAGVEFGQMEDRFFSRTNLALYPQDDVRLSIGHRYLGGDNAVAVGAEWQVAQRGVALFTEGLFTESLGDSVIGGVRIYLAPETKSLTRRHREDDPANDLKNAAQSLAGNKDPCAGKPSNVGKQWDPCKGPPS